MAKGDITTTDGIRFLELGAVDEDIPTSSINANELPTPFTNPELFKAFAFIIDGEVAIHQVYLISSYGSESTIAALSSSPMVVEIPMNMFGSVRNGYMYADGVFSPPTE